MKPSHNYTLLILISMVSWACEPEFDMYRHFITPKGEHYAAPRIVESLQSNTLTFDAIFDESAVYDFNDDALQTNKNKLMGFADCNSLHHENSARFAWQWYNNQLEIFAYCYVNGERVEEFVGVVELHQVNRYEIELTNNAYIFRLNNEATVSIPRGNTCDKGVYYKLWPYFGGSVPAPHDVHIAVKTIY